jgi:hypothetical protein
MRGGPALLGEISLLTSRDLAYNRAGNFPCKRSERAGPLLALVKLSEKSIESISK